MGVVSRFIGRRWELPAPLHRKIASEVVKIPMRDGVELVADRYYARNHPSQPTLLIRSCYGRGTFFKLAALLFAERGLQVLVQSCRGTGGSQGVFRPFFDEQNDGEDTVQWIERQPWFAAKLALWGGSYLGNTAWAVANSSGRERVNAMGLHVTLSNFRDRTYAFGGFTLEGSIAWTLTMSNLIRTSGSSMLAAVLQMRKTRGLATQAMNVLPLRDADRVLAPEGIAWWQQWMNHAEPNDPLWDAIDYGAAARTLPPTVMSAGWYDIFLPWQLRDFAAARATGRDVRITIGPWMHAALAGMKESMRQSVALFQEQFGLASRTPGALPKAPVRLFLIGANEWHEYPSWPIPGAGERIFHLRAGGVLSTAPAIAEDRSGFDYDPAHPTPAYHGPTVQGKTGSGDMAAMERRADVLVFSSEPLTADLDVIGVVSAEIFLWSSVRHTDLYLCLCDVTPGGVSSNVCDGYIRLRPGMPPAAPPDETGARQVPVEFWPTAYRFHRGHRLRIIAASAAHPRYARNTGSAESLGDARTLVVAHQQLLHGPRHPSVIRVPVVT